MSFKWQTGGIQDEKPSHRANPGPSVDFTQGDTQCEKPREDLSAGIEGEILSLRNFMSVFHTTNCSFTQGFTLLDLRLTVFRSCPRKSNNVQMIDRSNNIHKSGNNVKGLKKKVYCFMSLQPRHTGNHFFFIKLLRANQKF